jgi:hypothetical protein
VLNPRIRNALIVLAASAGLGACTGFGPYGGVGVGVGNYGYGGYGGYDGYGYGSPYDSYYGGYPYYGWYDGFYYPGSGYWVYDHWGHPRPITEKQKSYWVNVIQKAREARGGTLEAKENWSGFSKQGKVAAPVSVGGSGNAQGNANAQADPRSMRRVGEARSQQAQAERRQVQAERQQVRAERQEAVRQQVLERRESRRAGKSDDD